MRKIISGVIIECVLLVTHCSAQSITWQRIYDGPAHRSDVSRDVCQSTDGNYYIAGWTKTLVNNQPAIWVLKINQFGDTLWTRAITTAPYGPQAYAVAPSHDGGCVVTGDSFQDSSFALKLSSSGDIVWWKSYGVGGSNARRACFDIVKTLDDGFILCGVELSPYGSYGYILRIDPQGNLMWQRVYWNLGGGRVFASIIEHDGYFIVCGSRILDNISRASIAKFDTLGGIIWEKNYLIDNKDAGTKSVSVTNSGYLIGGQALWNVYTESFFIKTDFEGNLYFTKLFPPQNSASEYGDLKIINHNRYVISITIDSQAYPIVYKIRNMITDSSGNIVHEGIFSNGGEDKFYSILPLPNGDIIFTGWTEPPNSAYSDVYAIRTDSMLIAPPIGIKPVNNEVPVSIKLYQNYPNPFNSSTHVRFDINEYSENVKIVIYDILGRQIDVLVDQPLSAGSYDITWNAAGFSSGIYICRLFFNGTAHSSKMLSIK